MIYGSECWVVDRNIERSMSVAEMRMLKWMSAVTKHKIRNEYVRGGIGVTLIVDNMREYRLRWLGYMMRREETKTVE